VLSSQPSEEIAGKLLKKSPTGIYGLDEITQGGLPKGRVSLICGGPGSGKTMLATEFLVRGAQQYDEPGVFMAFEETEDELVKNVASLGFDLGSLIEKDLVAVDYIHIDPYEIQETGEYDLEGLFLRLGLAIDRVGAKRVVLDTLEALFSGFSNQMILRAELRRLFRWLKERDITAIVTAERGEEGLTRFGLEEYVSDCVIVLDHRVKNQISTRHVRIVKYRGSSHGTNEYPFLIGDNGISILPITSLALDHEAGSERVSTGVPGLDEMLEGEGYYRGTTVLLTGTAGTGKTSLATSFVDSLCRQGEPCLYLAFEESPQQLLRNMCSLGIDLQPWLDNGLLHVHATRPTLQGLEMHLVRLHRLIEQLEPAAVVIDPISNLIHMGERFEVESVLTRLIDYIKGKGITAVFTSLTAASEEIEKTEVGISSLVDTWILVKMIEINGERNRGLYVLKSRGMANSNQIREMRLTNNGVELVEVYLGRGGVLTGASRAIQEARDRAEALERTQQRERRRLELERKRRITEAQIAALRAELAAEEGEVEDLLRQEDAREALLSESGSSLAEIRRGRNSRETSGSAINGGKDHD
jgi:circadian clock protein KaiC